MKKNRLSVLFTLAAMSVACFLNAGNIKLSQFAGDYVNYGFSVGWTSPIGDASIPASRSQSNVAQFSLGKDGIGSINFISYTIHSAANPFGTTLSSNYINALTPIPIEFALTRPETGSGVVKIRNFPAMGVEIAFDLVARISPGDSKVEEMYLSQTIPGTANFPSNNASLIIAKRQ